MLALSWLYVGYVGLMLAYAGFMLAYVGSSWVKLAHVGSSWPQDASMLVQVGLKMPKMASQGLQKANFLRFFIENCSCWNTLNLQNIEKRMFYRSVCDLHFFVSLHAFGVSKLAQVRSKLAHVGLLEQI